MDSVITIKQTEELGEKLKQQGKHVVLVGGCFDFLHFGHITFLQEAKRQGDCLVVLLESDKRIQELKGTDRPIHTQEQRAAMLTALKDVDYVLLLADTMTDNDYDAVVKQLRPAIIATTKGSGSIAYIEKQAKEYGAQIYLVDQVEHISTTRIVDIITKEF